MLDPQIISQAFIDSCEGELLAPKPGNVHIFAEGHGMTAQDFISSAAAAAPFIAQPGLHVGQRILGAMHGAKYPLADVKPWLSDKGRCRGCAGDEVLRRHAMAFSEDMNVARFGRQ